MLNKETKKIFDVICKKFDEMNKLRDNAITRHREIIKISSLSIRATHREDYKEAENLIKQAQEKSEKLNAGLKNYPQIYYSGFIHDCQKEFAESCITLALIRDEKIATPADIGVDYPAYLNGMCEAIGEVRRHIVDRMRKNDLKNSEELLLLMDEIYYMMISIDYPDAITMGLRRTTDIARSLIEKTRGELTLHMRQNSLEEKMHKLEKKL
ncbi:MAG: haloacid dehalogenase [Armatimonadota bacterium]